MKKVNLLYVWYLIRTWIDKYILDAESLYYMVINGKDRILNSKTMKTFEFNEGDKLEEIQGPMVNPSPYRCSCGSIMFTAWIGTDWYWASFESERMEESGDFLMMFKGTCKHCGEVFYKGVLDRGEWFCDKNGKRLEEQPL